ncbi:hypothetical protein [Flavicella sp.]|uniref:hypothetical protein n=1 Tax=Flavicella sp. TaxID=2957742 RepID=UPI0030191160
MKNDQILIYQNQDGNIKIDVHLEGETVWLTQVQMATLFGKAKSTISEHTKNVFSEGELDKMATVRNFRTVQQEGDRKIMVKGKLLMVNECANIHHSQLIINN